MCAKSQPLPIINTLTLRRWPEEKGRLVQFRLLYRGELPSNGSPKEKHAIRRAFHPQLKELWDQVSPMSMWTRYEFLGGNMSSTVARPNPGATYSDKIADNYQTGPFRFLPLVAKEIGLACALDVLILRRDIPGNLIKNGGDIDNRLKTLFDALRRPDQTDQVARCEPQDGENPFYCLLADDSLITEVRVVTDRLLEPLKLGEGLNDVSMVIHVRLLVTNHRLADMEFWESRHEDGYGVPQPYTDPSKNT